MIQNTTFLRSKKLWIIVVLSAITAILVEPGRFTHPALQPNDYSAESFGVSDSNGGFFQLDSNQTRFDIVPGEYESVVASWTFLSSKKIELKSGVSNWAVQDEDGSAEVVYSVRQNQLVLLSDFKSRPGNSQTFILEVDSGDVVSVEANKGTLLLEDIGFVEVKEYRPFDNYLIVLSILLFWIVCILFFYDGYWLASLPFFVSASLLWLAMYAYDQHINTIQFVWSVSFFAVLASLFSIVQSPTNPKVRAILKILFLGLAVALNVLPFAIFLYTNLFGKPLETSDYLAFFQTDVSESIAYLRFTSQQWWVIVVLFLPVLFLPVLFIKKKKTQHLKFILATTVVLLVIASSTSTPKAISLASESYLTYSTEVDLFKASLRDFDESQAQLEVLKKKDTEIYFVIIGEAQSKFHMSQFGYVRPTTPRLDSIAKLNNTVILSNAISPHTHTAMSLSAALTQANESNGLDFQNCPSIINIMNAADVHTHWISNQLKYGIWDNPVSVIAEQCNDETFINSHVGKSNETDDFDGTLLGILKNKLADLEEGSHVFFIHLMGNHTEYNKRYPAEFALFDNDNFKSLFGNLNPYQVDPYDNSIIYNDFVVSEMIGLLDSVRIDRKAIFYFADHAEDLIEKHGHSSSLFNYRMIHIPSYFWFSNGYLSNYPDRVANLKRNRTKYFTNDLVYDAILGLTGVETKASNSDGQNLFSSNYHLQASSILILNHLPFTDPEHAEYHQAVNLHSLHSDSSISFQTFPHRVDTKGMLFEVVAKGFRGIECDLIFNDSVFEVGHGGEEYMSGNTLEDYLSSAAGDSLNFIWLDLKNFRSDNVDQILERLLWLDEHFDIKGRVLVESDTKTPLFERIRAQGFNTSYYLPTDIAQLENTAVLKEKAKEISAQIIRQKVSSISFDATLYNWVCNYLAPLISKDLEWHTWQLDLELQQTDFNQRLRSQPFASDSRINTVLVRVNSPYYL